MKLIQVLTRAQWRQWLQDNHDKEPKGIWLVLAKKKPGSSTLTYTESVEEALCYGWIDSTIKRIDDTHYCQNLPRERPVAAGPASIKDEWRNSLARTG